MAQPIAAKSGRTGHFKQPQMGPVEVGPLGLRDDVIVDTKHHGGPDQAVYLFGETDAAWWKDDLQRPVPAGFFGENMRIDGLASADLALGDRLRIGSVELQITSARIPCVTFAARIDDPQGVKRFVAAQRPGAYARVRRKGSVEALDPVTLLPFDGDRVGIVEIFAAFHAKWPDATLLERILQVPAHAGLHQTARERLGVAGG